MNLTSGSSFSNTWKRIRFRHIAAAAGVATALSAFVALGGPGTWDSAQEQSTAAVSRAPAQPAPEAPRAAARAPEARELIYYLVDTQEQAHALEATLAQAANERAEAGDYGPPAPTYSVIAVDTPMGKLAAQDLTTWVVAEFESEGGAARVIDLRTSP